MSVCATGLTDRHRELRAVFRDKGRPRRHQFGHRSESKFRGRVPVDMNGVVVINHRSRSRRHRPISQQLECPHGVNYYCG